MTTVFATGECPGGAFSPLACIFCIYGHIGEEVECSYPQREMEEEADNGN